MSAIQDAFAVAKKIFLVSDQIDRLSEDVKTLSHAVADHEIRLVRIETTMDIAKRSPRRTLKGN